MRATTTASPATWSRPAKLHHVAGRDGIAVAFRLHQHQLAHVIDGLETAGEHALGQPDTDIVAKAGSAREPISANGGEMFALVPLCETPHHLGRQRTEDRLRRYAKTSRCKVG